MATRRPRPGSLPLREKLEESDAAAVDGFDPRTALPPWMTDDPKKIEAWDKELKRRENEEAFTALRKARAKAEELSGAVRNAAFEDWILRSVVNAQEPSEWTQAQVLYENYLAHAKTFGDNRTQRAQSIQELATQTQWGRMMATLFPKRRRSAGWYYPLRCKRGG